MNNQCPNCQRLLYDRRLTHCGYCGKPIPKSLQFTAEQTAEIDQEMEEMKAQQLQRERAAEKDAQEAAEANSPIFPSL